MGGSYECDVMATSALRFSMLEIRITFYYETIQTENRVDANDCAPWYVDLSRLGATLCSIATA